MNSRARPKSFDWGTDPPSRKRSVDDHDTRIIAVLDACVLYSAPVRDVLLRCACEGLFFARWTDRIHEEWIGALLAQRPDLNREQLERTRLMMNAHATECLVEGYSHRERDIQLPDPADRHVVAAAIHASAHLIITYNLADFPARTLMAHGLVAIHPDAFLSALFDTDRNTTLSAVRMQRASLKHPPMAAECLLEAFLRSGLRNFAQRISENRRSI